MLDEKAQAIFRDSPNLNKLVQSQRGIGAMRGAIRSARDLEPAAYDFEDNKFDQFDR